MKEERKTYTLAEVVGITKDILRNISIPAELTEQIGLPILSAIRNLTIVKQQMEEAAVAAEIQNEKPEEPEEGNDNG